MTQRTIPYGDLIESRFEVRETDPVRGADGKLWKTWEHTGRATFICRGYIVHAESFVHDKVNCKIVCQCKDDANVYSIV